MPAQRLDDGFSTIFTLRNAPNIKLWEKEVTPPGMSGGGPVDTTTMRNTRYRTQSPKQLITLSAMTITAAYSPDVYEDIKQQINVNQIIDAQYPDGSRVAFWGWLDEFTPGAHVEGEQPTATVTIQPSNHNNDAPPLEVEPEYFDPEDSADLES